MAFQDLWQGAKRFFGPDNPFFHGPQEEQPSQPMEEQPAPEAPVPEQPYQQPVYQAQPQQPAYQPQQAYQQPQQAAYQNPYQQPQQTYQQPQPQVQNAQQSPFQQGYRPPQPQQNVNDPYVAPRNRRSAQHQQPQQPQMPPQQAPQMDANGNVVPFPGAAQPQKSANACVINVRSIADCRNAIGILRSNDCVIAVMDSIADQAEIRRYVDTLNGACFSLGCTMTRLSARVGVYLLAPVGMNVYTDQATTQMNSQSRAPQRPQQPQQAFRPPYQPQPQQGAYQQPQHAAPMFSAQSPAQGYSPDVTENEYNAI